MYTPSPSDFDVSVARGIKFLAQCYGPHWHNRIDITTLDVSDPDGCVLTQVSGMDFGHAGAHHNLSGPDEKLYGFHHNLLDGASEQEVDFHYEVLTEAWKRAILDIREGIDVETATPEFAAAA